MENPLDQRWAALVQAQALDPREQLVDQFKADLAVIGPGQVERIRRDVKARGGLRHLMIVESEGADDGR